MPVSATAHPGRRQDPARSPALAIPIGRLPRSSRSPADSGLVQGRLEGRVGRLHQPEQPARREPLIRNPGAELGQSRLPALAVVRGDGEHGPGWDPVEGAHIDATLLGEPVIPVVFPRTRTKTDAAGPFILPALMPGIWELEVRKRDAFLPRQLDVIVTGEDAPLAIGLERGAVWTGTVVDAAGRSGLGRVVLRRDGRNLASGDVPTRRNRWLEVGLERSCKGN